MPLTIGVPKETYPGERRVATVPEVVEKLKKLGFAVLVESGAGAAPNSDDDAYRAAGAGIAANAAELWSSSDIVFKVIQADYMAGVGGVNALQARDVYADISLDPAREFRARIGLSKVPYAWSNLQSSQNRLALERTDSINSAAEGERDLGVYLMWAPYQIRNRFKDLVKMGLRGSGDYGSIPIGAYNGQGINNNDRNGQPHFASPVPPTPSNCQTASSSNSASMATPGTMSQQPRGSVRSRHLPLMPVV